MPESSTPLTVEPSDPRTRRAVYDALEKQFGGRFQVPLTLEGNIVVFRDIGGHEKRRVSLDTVQQWIETSRQGARLVLKSAA